jgi:hypothetical protein
MTNNDNSSNRHKKDYISELPLEIFEHLLKKENMMYEILVIAHTSNTNMQNLLPFFKNNVDIREIKKACNYTSKNGYWNLCEWFHNHYDYFYYGNIVIFNAAEQGNQNFLEKDKMKKLIFSDDHNIVALIKGVITSERFDMMHHYLRKVFYNKKDSNFVRTDRTSEIITFDKFIPIIAKKDNLDEYMWMAKIFSYNNKQTINHVIVQSIIKYGGYNILLWLHHNKKSIFLDDKWKNNDEIARSAILSDNINIFKWCYQNQHDIYYNQIQSFIVERNKLDMFKILYEDKKISKRRCYKKSLISGSYEIFEYLLENGEHIPDDILNEFHEDYNPIYYYPNNPGTVKIMQSLFVHGHNPSLKLFEHILERDDIDLLYNINCDPFKENIMESIYTRRNRSIKMIQWALITFGDIIEIDKILSLVLLKGEINIVEWLVKERNIVIDSELLINIVIDMKFLTPKNHLFKKSSGRPARKWPTFYFSRLYFGVDALEYLYIYGNMDEHFWNILLNKERYSTTEGYEFIKKYISKF